MRVTDWEDRGLEGLGKMDTDVGRGRTEGEGTYRNTGYVLGWGWIGFGY